MNSLKYCLASIKHQSKICLGDEFSSQTRKDISALVNLKTQFFVNLFKVFPKTIGIIPALKY